ncbi:MAG: hypothetical protein A4E44_00880 [Methanosaeta sp. PtaB.Bin018]|nr:DNRLRE domain-containing protein [Methanothrix sp.]OPX76107.1 MAG: hypothetical protein A4E44_00880 [Methanosaeta sp. PtaB.Bin018]OPY45902.1 MAG: hypothetical protein A4E46_01093 [Methanosaeta sp. PtaU1.Bin016]HOV52095.1 DNRLRE domain-containing protein [Methanothrix sp.]
MRSSYALIGLFLLLAASAEAGSFKANTDVETYVDANYIDQSFSDNDTLWAASEDGKSFQEVYLSFVNLFGSQGIFKPEQIQSATLALDAVQVKEPGEIRAYLVHGATFDTATWNDKPEYNPDVSASVEISKEGSYTIDVTPLIKKAVEICTEGCPYSIALVAEDGASVGFASSRASSGSRPVLEYVS